MAKTNRNYPTTVAGVWKNKSGTLFRSMEIDARAFDAIKAFAEKVELGGRVRVKLTNPETKEERGKSFPDAFIEYMTKEQVAEEEAFIKSKQPNDSL